VYAIIETGGKQYKVAEGDVISVEKLGAEANSEFVFDKVLVLSDDKDLKIGAPYVDGAKVTATVVCEGKGKKVIVYKYKPKKGFHKKNGHRQPFTKLQINNISC
jgi:large subunit ribosomal protein L21